MTTSNHVNTPTDAPIAWVLGASGYWGQKISLSLWRKGYKVVAFSRNEPDGLLQWARANQYSAAWWPLDLSHPADMTARLKEAGQAPDVLFYCGGSPQADSFADLLALNVVAPARLLGPLIGAMEARGHGRIGVLVHPFAWETMSGLAEFCASQAALWSWVESEATRLKMLKKPQLSLSLVVPPLAPSSLHKTLNEQTPLSSPKPPAHADSLVASVLKGQAKVEG